MVPAQVQFPAVACDACALRAQCTKAAHGQGRSLGIREDEQFQKLVSQDEDAAWTGLAPQTDGGGAHDCASIGCTKDVAPDTKACANQFDGCRHAAVSNLQVAARYEEEHRLASLRYHRIDQCSRRPRELPDRGHLGVTSLLAGGRIPWPMGLVHCGPGGWGIRSAPSW